MKKPSNKFSVDNAGQDFVAGIYRQDGLSTGDPVNRKKGGKVAKKNMGGKMDQGYNARKDEQLGMTMGKEEDKKMSMKGRRDVAKATRKPKGTYGFS
jgi:hypothetical protein|tara:strand:+ start:5274 stop:5564 length:291 start_codon:yes stop_codon:yes gene_type:complete